MNLSNNHALSEIVCLSQKYAEVTKRLEKLERLSADIAAGRFSDELRLECPELVAKEGEVGKCRYRIEIMKRRIEELKNVSGKKSQTSETKAKEQKVARKYVKVLDYGDSILERLVSVFTQTVKETFPQIDIPIQLRETSNLKFGDYQFESSPLIAKKLSDVGIKMNPVEVSKKLMENLPELDLIDKIEPVKFFINIFINPRVVGIRVASAFLNGVTVPQLEKRRVCCDFSSPNIAKQMHVGHLRSTIIGESFARLMEFVGFHVIRINHIGDWGTQFGMLIAHLQDSFPNFATETPPIADLQAFYKESKKRFDEDAEFKERAKDCVVRLQSHDPLFINAWKLICDVSRRDFEQIYKRLDVSIEERGESFYQDRMVQVVRYLEEQELLQNDDGRKIFWPSGAAIPLTIVKSDGGFTYDTSDMATIRHRLFEEQGDWLLYVVDAGQSAHFETIFAAARDLKWYEPEKTRVEHVQFGVVLGEDKKKFKTRSGDTVRLTDLLDEGIRRAEAKLREKGREEVMTPEELNEAKEALAYGCIRYADLSSGRVSDYIFSFDRMLDDRGNTAVYLLYAYARIMSIIRNAGVEHERTVEYVNKLSGSHLPLDHPAELKFSLQLHRLCEYLYTLATMFHDFYKDRYVVNKAADGTTEINFHRLVLCHVTADVMKTCFKILGIRPIEKIRKMKSLYKRKNEDAGAEKKEEK